ncbi:filamin-A isoform X2 [Periplaneta americana]|uniref:filamin-A isoform X2 n=1 Tax=Periplaneta americana TaxID=6978 RepID=UPI0037E8BA99
MNNNNEAGAESCSTDEQDEMVATERELAEDAQWKRIQQNTFTRWANEHLKTVNKHIGNLETDLCDGLRLITLIEVLSGKRLPKHNKRPTFRSQKLENVSVALKFLEDDESIRIVNIDSTDIVDCKLKLILGLIWTLILHYSISMPMWEGEEEAQHGEGKGPTPKQRLLHWIQSKVPDLPITNFTSDWNDGKAVGALVDAVAPGLCPDWQDWNPKDSVQNASEAMGLADDWLNVRQLIKPEEMVNPNMDEMSMMTYLSQYPSAKLKSGAPLRPRTNPNRVRAYGPGIEPTGPVVGAPANFTVETFSAGKGKIDVTVENPNGQLEPVDIRFNKDRNLTYSVSYVPRSEGDHKVSVKFAGREIPKSPYTVSVEGHAGDPSKVTASGPGLQPDGVMINRPTYFDISTKDAGRGVPEVIILDPSGHKNTVPVKVRPISPDVWRCEYVSSAVGLHSVNVFFAGQPIPNSPYGVRVAPVSDAKKVRASGRGLQPSGVRVGDDADFKIYTEGAGEGSPEVRVIGPGGVNEPVKVRKVDGTTYEAVYHPRKDGRHVVMVTFAGQEIPRSPFDVNVSPFKQTRIRAYGPGLVGGVVGYPALFTVETNGETGALGFSIEGPSQAKIECHDNGDGSADVRYYPTAPGEYAVHILCDNEDIPKSPYISQILPNTDYYPDKVECSGPGIQRDGVMKGQRAQFTVDTRRAGSAPLDVQVLDANCNNIDVNVRSNGDGTFTCEYVPKTGSRHTVQVNYGGVATRNSPHRVFVSEPANASKVHIFGPGVEKGVKCNTPTHFNIDRRDAGQGDIKMALTNEKGIDVPLAVTDNEDGTFTVDYCAPTPGTYTLNVLYAGVPVPRCPLRVPIQPHVDVSKIKVDGLEPSVYVDSPTDFVVDSRAIAKRDDGKVTCTITNPSGTRTENLITPLADGTYRISYTPFEEGRHTIDILYDGLPIPGSPFVVNVRRGCDPSKCRAFGPGLEHGLVDQANMFTVETKGAGTGGLGLAIEGPSEAKMTCKDNRDGSCSVEYVPTEPGDYDVSIKFADQHIPGSPFKVPVDKSVDVSSVKAFGPGLDPKKCRAGTPLAFKVDASKSGKAPLGVTIQSDRGPLAPDVRDNGDGTYDVTYMPPSEGSNVKAKITWDGKDIPNSPYQMKVRPRVEPDQVKVEGPGVSGKGIPASLPAEFTIDTSQAGYGDLEVQVKGPDGYPRKVKVADNGDGTFKATYIPDDCGRYKVSVKYGGKEVPHSPFQVQAFATGSAEKCQITEGIQHALTSGEEYCITVNAQNAGYGAVTCRIRSTSGSDLDIDIEDNGDGTFSIYYTVKDAGDYTLSVKFGGQPVPDGFYTFTAGSEDYVKQTTATKETRHPGQQQYRPVQLNNIPLPTTGGHVTSDIKMPSGNVDKPIIEDNRDGTVSIKYEPREEGLHELSVKYNGEHVQGSPFKFHVDSLSSGYVTAYGPGLTHGVCGEPSNFTISTKGAGAGGLSLAVEGPSKAEISCHDNKDGTVSVSYLPTAPGEYKISVKFGDKHIKGSPYNAKITGEGRKRNQISVGSCSEVSFPGKVSDADIRSLNASIQAPSGLEEPCFLKRLPNGNIGISFTPREVGEHVVSVKRLGKHIANSPFKINVGEREVGDAKKVKVTGHALKEGSTHVDNTFTVDTRNAGYGGLSLSIEGPSKAEIQCKDNEDGTLNISYKPTEPGYYIVNLKFADHHVDGSPFTVKVGGEGSNRQREKIQRQREAVPITEVGSECKLTFKMPGITSFDLMATVTSPGGVTEDAEINEVEDGLYAVHFVPKELGVHTVSVKYKEMHIPGSPFQFTVGPLKDGGAHRVHAGGPGLERGEQGQPCEFNVWTREAGAGSLAISVEGPSKAGIDFKDRKDGSCYVSYVVSEPGEYRVGIKFNDQHIPDSPYKLFISPAMGDAHKLEVFQFPNAGVQADKPAAFLVRKNGAKGELDAKIVSPSGTEDDCFIQSIDPDTYSVRFMPRENGIHNIHVKFNGVHMPGSPFRIKVGKEDADPAAVHAQGNGLGEVKTGQKTDFLVDTCNAGAGTLAVTIDGPSKVSMDCTEVEEGYKVRYTPLVPGEYFISIKYNGYHIVGSPFKVNCSGEDLAERGAQETSSVVVETVQKVSKSKQVGPVLPLFKSDASKVTSKGMGLKKAYLQKQNMFTVHAGDAGNNILYVGVYGPKSPCEEVFIKHMGRNNYQVNYVVRERGEYIVIVKWGDDHIPGSPFKVDV